MRMNRWAAVWAGLCGAALSVNGCSCNRTPGATGDNPDASMTSSSSSGGQTGTPQPPPVGIARLEPGQGPTNGGTVLVMRGYNFTPTVSVSIGGAAATDVTVTDSQTLSLTTPPGTEGAADVALTNSDTARTVFTGGFTYLTLGPDAPPAPALTAVVPNQGPTTGGTVASLTGENFQPGAIVVVGGRPARRVYFISPTQLTVVFPEGQVGTAKVAVTNPDGRSDLLLGAFAYYDPTGATAPPQIMTVIPADGPVTGGQDTAVTGSALDPAVLAYLAGVPLALSEVTTGAFRFVSPPGRRGLAPLMVTNPDGQSAVLDDAYNYFSPPPVVLSAAPAYADRAGGVPLTILGRWFQDGATVTVGSLALVNAAVADAQTITGVVPASDVGGAVDVTVKNPDGLASTLAGGFYYVDETHPPPDANVRVVRLSPASGPTTGSINVTAFGSGFADGATVRVGGNEATNVRVFGGTSLSFRLPAGNVGAVDVEVVNPGLAPALLRNGFIYFDANAAGTPPTVTSVSPRTSRIDGGGTIAVFGTGFDRNARVYLGGNESSRVRVAGDTSLSAVVPAAEAATVDIIVVNPDGKSGRLVGGFAYYDGAAGPAPTLTGLTPSTGGSAVSTSVSVGGTNFAADAVLFVDGIFVLSALQNDTALTADFPPHEAGQVDVTVTNADGQSATAVGAFTYTTSAAPVVGSISPSQGNEGETTIITIAGSGYVPGTTVTVNGTPVEVTFLGSGSLTAVIPPQPVGPADITVTNPDGQSTTVTGGFTSVSAGGASVAITGVEPMSGPATGGTRVALSGRGLGSATDVKFGSAAAVDLSVLGSTVVQCTTPAGPVGPVDVTLTLGDGTQVVRPNGWVFVSTSAGPWPTVERVAPAQGPMTGGTPVIVTGTRLYAGTRVFVGGAEATDVVHVNDNTLTARTPAHATAEAADLMVVRTDGTNARAAGGFTYYDPATSPNAQPSPRVDSVSPTTASTLGGSVMALSGDHFRDGVLVLVDGVPAENVVRGSNSRVTFSAPPHAPGAATVSVVNADGTFAVWTGGLTYAAQPPVITEISPTEGPRVGYTGVTIRGAGFSPGVDVLFNGVNSPDVLVLDPGLILALTPPGAAGAADITVVNPDGQSATATAGFTYFDGNYADQAPLLTALSPARSVTTGGTLVSVTGQNLLPGGRLIFGQVTAADLVVVSRTEASVLTPAMPPGVVDVAWVGPDGQVSVLRNAFTFSDDTGPAPQLGGAAPNRGPETGFTPTTVAGANFRPGAVVFFGRSAATQTVVLSGAFINTRTPPHVPGTVSLTVTQADGISTTLPNAYAYVASPAILGVNPAVIRQNTSGPVQIAGRNFAAGARVYFGSVLSSLVTVSSDALIIATAPAQSAGPVDVIVENVDGQRAILPFGFEYLSTPGLTDVDPGSAPTTAGSRVILVGDGFRRGLRVYVGGVEATDVIFVDERTVTVHLPAGATGSQDVRVVNPDNQEVILTGGITRVDVSTLGAAPTLTGCLPDRGRITGATAVRLAGSNYAPGAFAFYGGVPALTGFVDAALLATRTPPGIPGPTTVEVTNPDGQTAGKANCFTYTDNLGADPPPVVSVVQPSEGPTLGGSDIVVAGDNFRAGAVVLVGNRLASSIVVASSTRIDARTPPGTVGPVDVTVSNTDGTTGTLPGGYRYLAPPMVITVTPPEGPSAGGTQITIGGENFLVGAQVRVGGNLATSITVVGPRSITAVTPAGTPGVVEVSVVNSDGQVGSLPGGFAYTTPPVVLSVSPVAGSTRGDEFVTIAGSGFRANARVMFGALESPQVQVLSGTGIRVRTPAQAAGRVDVTVTNVDGYSDTLASAYEYLAPPVVAAVSPASGPDTGGTGVTIVGSGFRANPAVQFGGVDALNVTVVSSTVITADTPPRPSGPAAVTVRNTDGQETTLAAGFYYFPPVPPPRITSISPNFGPVTGGTIATITGDDFQYGARVFLRTAEVTPADVAVLAQTQIRVRIPAAAVEGPALVRVLNPDGQAMTLNNAFTYMPALALPPLGLSAITPNRLTTAGDVLATVLGNGMATDVRFEVVLGTTRVPVTLERYFSDVAVQVRLPAVGAAGLYDFVATVPSTGTTATLAGRVEYKDVSITFTMDRGRLPNDSRVSDQQVISADFNNDGFRDLMFFRYNRQSVLYQNRGAAQPAWFDDVTSQNLLGEADSRAWYEDHANWLVADFNLDGFPDVVSQENSPGSDWRYLRVWESQGYGKLQYGRSFSGTAAPAWQAAIYDWVVGDIDNADGPDILLCNGGNYGEDIWLQNRGVVKDAGGNPVLDAQGRPQWIGFMQQGFRAIVNGNPATPTEDTRGCDLGDFDLDGDLDVIMGNAGNQANRLYVNDIATTGAIRRETIIDEFTSGESWGESQMTGSWAAGIYRGQITNNSDPYMGKGFSSFDPRQATMEMRIKGYAGGPTGITVYYTDNNADCGGRSGTCGQSFTNVGIPTDGSYATITVTMTDPEWVDADGWINTLWIDFDGMTAPANTATSYVEIDWIKFSGTYRSPQFIDASNSAQFTFGGDTRSTRFVDFDNDGDLDIIALNYNQDAYMAVNTVDGLGNRVFQNQPSRLCHNATCSLSASSPPLLNKGIRVSVGADVYGHFGGSPMNPADKWLDINQDGCTDLAIWWDTTDGVPRYYVNRKVGTGAASCTGEFYYKDPADTDVTNPLRNLYQASFNPNEQKTLFGREIDSTASTRNHWFTMSDLDADGWLDMVQVPFAYSARTGQQKRIYMRKPVTEGTVTFRRFIDETMNNQLPRSMQRCARAEATDVNRDGAKDLIIMPSGTCAETDDQIRMRVLLNDGAGNFSDGSNRFPFVRGYTKDMVVADFNGDNLDDVMVLYVYTCAGWDTSLRLFQNHGDGFFDDVTAAANLGSGVSSMTTDGRWHLNALTAIDVDGDGDNDVAITGGQYYDRRLLINGGDPLSVGSPYFIDRTGSLPAIYGTRFVPLDYNADGKMDLYMAWWGGQNKLYENDGLGNFSDVTLQSTNQVTANTYVALPAPFVAVRQADGTLLGKPYPDLFLVTSGSGPAQGNRRQIHVSGLDTVTNRVRFSDLTDSNMRPGTDGRTSFRGRVVDWDHDGRADVLMNGWEDRPIFYNNVGNAVFEDKSANYLPEHYMEATNDIVVADFDRDGDEDVFMCNYFQQHRLLWNREIP